MNSADANLCKTNLLATDCNSVAGCEKGCCYNPIQGICSLNSPKDKCVLEGGNWSKDATCNIPQCTLGCCILGNQASITTTRECTLLSQQLNFEKKFEALDSDGSCNSKTNLGDRGACLTLADDYSGLNDCKFTSKGNCKGDFKPGFLCTAKELKTNCKPARNTTCLSDRDGIYYLDTCGNIANIYDASKFNDDNYWSKIIEPKNSCSPASKDCGNCDYLSGSRCEAYRQGKDTKPSIGNNVCRDLNCANGKKHGESWCVGDYSSEADAVAPVGSRWFKGICMEGEISIEPCADFNQEICVQSNGDSGFTEAQCMINDWRSCIAANEKETYQEVEGECKKYSQCVMFLDIPGNEKYENLPGFKKEVINTDQARVGSVGKDMNKVIPWCVPKYTPGLVFWNTNDKTASNAFQNLMNKQTGSKTQTSQTQSQSFTGLGNGGSLEETQAICSLGNFVCITQRKQEGSGSMKDVSWKNTECYEAKDSEKASLWAEGLTERCRSLGPCSMYINVAGEFGSNGKEENYSAFTRVHIDKDGDASQKKEVFLNISESYFGDLGGKAGVRKIGSISKLTSLVISALTGKVIDNPDTVTATNEAKSQAPSEPMGVLSSSLSAVGMGYLTVQAGSYALGAAGSGAYTLGYFGAVAAAAIAGYMVGQVIGKAFGLSNSQTQSLSYSLAVGGALTTAILISEMAKVCAATGGAVAACIGAVVIIAVLTYMWTYEEQEYWITTYTCEPWEAPDKGDCNLCNEDVRTCSEYRCRSLGMNCHYYNANGEPGVCASFEDTWSATIKPWQEILNQELKYTQVKETGFKIEDKSRELVELWNPVTFGIITSDMAQCKIDNKHTKTFEEMSTDMIIDNTIGCENGKCVNQGTHHKVALSPHIGASNGSGSSGSSSGTLSFSEGENNYYIRCKNFAGNYNRAEFAVKIIANSGPDYTPPVITRFIPSSGNYLKVGSNSTSVIFFVNEPSTCKYSQDFNELFENMNSSVFCNTDPNSAVLAEWPCYASLKNLKVGENKFYFQCEDHPEYDQNNTGRKNINRNSKSYSLNVCSKNLSITSLEPKSTFVIGKPPVAVEIKVSTDGCIENGKSVCYYKFNGNQSDNSQYISFLNTNNNKHTQLFKNMIEGNHNISVKCEDNAGNIAYDSLEVNIELDNSAPLVLRTYQMNQMLYLITDEDAKCGFTNNKTIGCGFNINGSVNLMDSSGKTQKAKVEANQNYYIKCKDKFNNENSDCAIMLRTY
jgi:hypothetical protein